MLQQLTALEYLKIDIANNYGLDKKNWDVRIDWFDENKHNLEQIENQAKDPCLYYAGVQAYKATQRGEAIGYPISLDSTSSNIQVLALLSNCKQSASICNLIDTGNRENAYQIIYDRFCGMTGDNLKVEYDKIKKAIMTSFFGSKATPNEIVKGDKRLLETFFEAMYECAPRAWELNEQIISMWRSDIDVNQWILPDNYHVHIPVKTVQDTDVMFFDTLHTVSTKEVSKLKASKSLCPNIVHSIDGYINRELIQRASISPQRKVKLLDIIHSSRTTHDNRNHEIVTTLWNHYKESKMLSSRILNYIDNSSINLVDRNIILDMVLKLPKRTFPILSTHDCWKIHPNYGNDLRQQYNNICSDIAGSDLLQFILSQYLGKRINVKSRYILKDIVKEANYAIC